MTRQGERVAERFDPATYPLWHGFSSMSFILERAGPEEMWVRGEGSWLVDAGGRRYLDARAGVGNMMLGYSREDIAMAMHRQTMELPFACTMRWERATPVVVDCARALVDAAPAGLTRVRFTHTGSSAVESALLMARSYHRNLGHKGKNVIVALRDSYHGSTMASMAASGQRVLHWFFGPMPGDFAHVPEPRNEADCVQELREGIERIGPERIAALILEPVKGRSGVPLPDHYVRAARELCTELDILLVFDEVLTGFGRMGAMFAAELSGVSPDIMCLAKGITAGYAALGAVLATDRIYDAFNQSEGSYFAHASSTDAHPVACAAALATLEAFQRDDAVAAGRRTGERLRERTQARLSGSPLFRDVRALGAYVAVGLAGPDGKVASMRMKRYLEMACMERGVLIDYTPDTVMFTPPLNLTVEEAELAADTLADVVLSYDDAAVDDSVLRPATLRGHR